MVNKKKVPTEINKNIHKKRTRSELTCGLRWTYCQQAKSGLYSKQKKKNLNHTYDMNILLVGLTLSLSSFSVRKKLFCTHEGDAIDRVAAQI